MEKLALNWVQYPELIRKYAKARTVAMSLAGMHNVRIEQIHFKSDQNNEEPAQGLRRYGAIYGRLSLKWQ